MKTDDNTSLLVNTVGSNPDLIGINTSNMTINDSTVINSTSNSSTVKEASSLISEYYAAYGSYLIDSRFLPNVYDGLKPPHKRLVYCANEVCPKSFVKSAKLLGETLSYHPHAVDGLYTALIGLTNGQLKVPIFKGKGSWGGFNSEAAAFRYTECHLNEVGRNYVQFLKYADMELGESGQKEPIAIPVLIPFSLLNGSRGMGVGLSTEVMPLNAMELIDYYIATIKGKSHKKIPTPDIGNYVLVMDDEDIDKAVADTKGQLVVKSVIVQENDHTVVVEGLINKDVQKFYNSKFKDLIKQNALDFRDESKKEPRYVFEITNLSVITPAELIERLNTATVSKMSFTRLVYEGNKAVFATLDYQVNQSLAYLNKVLDRKQETEIRQLERAKEKLLAVKYIKESGLLNTISSMTTDELDKTLQDAGFSLEVAKMARNNSISYLTKSHDNELVEIQNQLDSITQLDRTAYLVELYKDFKKLIKPLYDSRKHTLRSSQILESPRISLSRNKKEVIISDVGQLCDNSAVLVDKQGNFKLVNVFSQVKRIINIDSDMKAVGLITDKSDVGALYTNKNRIIARSFVDLRKCKPVLKLDNDEKVIGVLATVFNESGDALVEFEGHVYNLNIFIKQRVSSGIPNWKSKFIK